MIVRTLEHRVFAGDKFTCHREREFVPLTVNKLDGSAHLE